MNRITGTKHVIYMIGSTVPISTITNIATSGWRLHHHQHQQHSRKIANEEQDEATSLYICDELVMAQTRCTMVHSPSLCLFISDGGDNNSNIVSFDFRVMIAGKNLEHAQNTPCCLQSTVVYMHVQWAFGLSYPRVLIWSQVTQFDSFSCQIKVSTWTE